MKHLISLFLILFICFSFTASAQAQNPNDLYNTYQARMTHMENVAEITLKIFQLMSQEALKKQVTNELQKLKPHIDQSLMGDSKDGVLVEVPFHKYLLTGQISLGSVALRGQGPNVLAVWVEETKKPQLSVPLPAKVVPEPDASFWVWYSKDASGKIVTKIISSMEMNFYRAISSQYTGSRLDIERTLLLNEKAALQKQVESLKQQLPELQAAYEAQKNYGVDLKAHYERVIAEKDKTIISVLAEQKAAKKEADSWFISMHMDQREIKAYYKKELADLQKRWEQWAAQRPAQSSSSNKPQLRPADLTHTGERLINRPDKPSTTPSGNSGGSNKTETKTDTKDKDTNDGTLGDNRPN